LLKTRHLVQIREGGGARNSKLHRDRFSIKETLGAAALLALHGQPSHDAQRVGIPLSNHGCGAGVNALEEAHRGSAANRGAQHLSSCRRFRLRTTERPLRRYRVGAAIRAANEEGVTRERQPRRKVGRHDQFNVRVVAQKAAGRRCKGTEGFAKAQQFAAVLAALSVATDGGGYARDAQCNASGVGRILKRGCAIVARSGLVV
jgi:hypothetical protein